MAVQPPEVHSDAGGLPHAWAEISPGVRWRTASVPLDAPATGVFAWITSPRRSVWVVVRLDLKRVNVRVDRSLYNRLGVDGLDRGTLVAVNGGYFEPDSAPSGLVFSDGLLLAPMDPRGGSGVLTVGAGRADIVPVDRWDGGVPPRADVMLQCGPRLVERGGVSGIHSDDGRRFARTAACIRDAGATLDLVTVWDAEDPLRGPGLFQFAQILAGPSPVGDARGCETALNLDGGPSTGVYVRGAYLHASVGPMPWMIIVR